jgi:hypothetical protein
MLKSGQQGNYILHSKYSSVVARTPFTLGSSQALVIATKPQTCETTLELSDGGSLLFKRERGRRAKDEGRKIPAVQLKEIERQSMV